MVASWSSTSSFYGSDAIEMVAGRLFSTECCYLAPFFAPVAPTIGSDRFDTYPCEFHPVAYICAFLTYLFHLYLHLFDFLGTVSSIGLDCDDDIDPIYPTGFFPADSLFAIGFCATDPIYSTGFYVTDPIYFTGFFATGFYITDTGVGFFGVLGSVFS